MKRLFVKPCLFLLLGAIINVAGAWAIATRGPLLPFATPEDWVIGTGVDFGNCSVVLSYRARFGAAEVQWSAETGRFYPGNDCMQIEPYPEWLPWWTNVQTLLVNDEGDWKVTQFATGWPVRTMMHEFRESYLRNFDDPGSERWHWAWPLETNPMRALPLRPLWPGFAINTIFYAAILWLPVAGLGALRRRRRIKRGLCPACAYDLRGRGTQSLTCPECGRPVLQPLLRRI